MKKDVRRLLFVVPLFLGTRGKTSFDIKSHIPQNIHAVNIKTSKILNVNGLNRAGNVRGIVQCTDCLKDIRGFGVFLA